MFGASGGGDFSQNSLKPGKGGKTEGFYIIRKPYQDLYLYIGGKGETNIQDAKGGYNGGGKGKKGFGTTQPHGGGGGYTDIRTTTDPTTFIAIAGGGGGAGRDQVGIQYDTHGGDGGGETGSDGGNGFEENRRGLGGDQVKGGSGGFDTGGKGNAQDGAKFKGGNASSYAGSSGGGGGGGFYGGGGGHESGGGGGSGNCKQLINGVTTTGFNDDNGYIIISPFPVACSIYLKRSFPLHMFLVCIMIVKQ